MGKFCTNCGMENDQQAKFCIGCATPFMMSQPPEPPQPVSPQLEAEPVPVEASHLEVQPKVEPQQAYMPSTSPASPIQSYQQQSYQSNNNPSQGQYQNQPQPASVNVYNQGVSEVPFSIGGWIGLFLLSLIPGIGAIIVLIIALTSENKTMRNYGKAQLILIGISLALGIIAIFLIVVVFGISLWSLT